MKYEIVWNRKYDAGMYLIVNSIHQEFNFFSLSSLVGILRSDISRTYKKKKQKKNNEVIV